jgi:hypothetical protein
VVIRQSEQGSKSGTVWFDDALLSVSTGTDFPAGADISLSVFPNPVSTSGTVTFTLLERSLVNVDVVTLDGRKTENLINGWFDPGVKTIPWSPTLLTSDGICLIRMESRKNPEEVPAVATVKCVITRQK